MTPPAAEEFTDSGFFVLRTPLLPFDDLLALSSAVPGKPDGGADRGRSGPALRRGLERPEVREALWIASPELVRSLATWRAEPESAKGRRLEQALYRYWARMTARATPFGGFAGCSTGTVADATRLELGPRSGYRRHTRLDMECLCGLVERIAADPRWQPRLRFRVNTTWHPAAGRYHHVEAVGPPAARVFQLVATEITPALEATLARAAAGATASELASALVADEDEITLEEAGAFLGRLIESQLLVSELAPPVTGQEPLAYMTAQLEQAKAAGLAAELRGIDEALRALDRGGLGAAPSAYDGIASAVTRLGGAFEPGRLVRVDLLKPPAAVCLERRLLDDLLGAIQALHSIHGDAGQPALQQFQEAFQDRYGGREIPLLEALDDEAGIGFESDDNPALEPLLAGIDLLPAEAAPSLEDKEVPTVLARRLEELRAKEGMVLALDDGILEELRVPNPPPLPDAFCVMGAFFRGPDGRPGFCLQSVFGPSGANLLSRFRGDERLMEWVQAHLRAEEALRPRGGAVFAEIAHLPDGRVGNIAGRPVLREYEIPLLATPGVPAEGQIALSGLTVSLRQGRIVLRSPRLGAEVLPRLTSAHNFSGPHSLKLYKFLCLLQHQGTCPNLSWDWGPAGQAPFLPRVTLGNIVVSLARWSVDRETAQALVQGRTSVSQWRGAGRVPRFAFIAEYDNQLLIDFENALAVETFLDHLKKQGEAVLVEMFPGPEALAVRGPEGSFVHEMVVPLVRRHPAPAAVEVLPAEASPAAPEAVSGPGPEAGSGWLFAKLYCSPGNADRLLLELVKPLVEEALAAGHADGWFFVRYADPNWHLRLRLHGDPGVLQAQVLPRLRGRAGHHLALGTMWRLGFDTYEPETERYGGAAATAIAERLFQLDSTLCLELIDLVSRDPSADLRWQLALCSVDRLLAGMGFSLEERSRLAKSMARSCERAYVVDASYRKAMGARFREQRQALAALCDESRAAAALPEAARDAFAVFSAAAQAALRPLEELRRTGELTAPLRDLAVSFVHMRLNRLLRSAHHAQEAVLYNLLARSYAARQALA